MRYGPADRKIGGMAVKLEEKGHLRQAQEKSKEEKIRRHISDIQAGSLCKNYYKQQKPMSIDEEQLSEMESPSGSPEEKVTDKLMLEWALEQLPEEFRQVIDLYYFQEMKLSEIAGALGIGLPLVKHRLKQARNRLQALLRKEGTANEPG